MTPKAERLLKNFSAAVVEKSWGGSYSPEDSKAIAANYEVCRNALVEYIEELEALLDE